MGIWEFFKGKSIRKNILIGSLIYFFLFILFIFFLLFQYMNSVNNKGEQVLKRKIIEIKENDLKNACENIEKNIYFKKENLEEGLRKTLKLMLLEKKKLITKLYKTRKNDNQIKKLIVDILRESSLRVDNSVSYFIVDEKGNTILSNGFIKLRTKELLKKKKPFPDIFLLEENRDKYLTQIFCAFYFKPFRWFVGGEISQKKYREKFEKIALNEIKKRKLNIGEFIFLKINKKTFFHTDTKRLRRIQNLIIMNSERDSLIKKQKRGFINYTIINPKKKKSLSIVEYFSRKLSNPNILISYGIDLREIEKIVYQERKKFFSEYKLFLIKILTLFLLLNILFFYFLRKRIKPAYQDISRIVNFLKKEEHGKERVNLDLMKYNEPRLVAKNINLMIDKFKKANEEIQKNEEKFRTLLNQLKVGVYMFGVDEYFTYVNDTMVEVTGYSKEELYKKRFHDLIHPDFKEITKRRAEKRLSGLKTKDTYNIKIITKNGEEKWVRLSNKKINLFKENVVLGTAIDVTEQVQAEQLLKESEEKFKTFTDQIKAAVFTFNEDGYFEYVNKAMLRITGYTKEELLQKKFFEIVHPDYRDLVLKRGYKRLEGKTPTDTYEFKILTKRGKSKWVQLSNKKIALKERNIVLGSAIDITEKKEAEELLLESEEKFRNIYEKSADPMCLLTKEGFIDCNKASYDMLKTTKKEALIIHPGKISPEKQPDGSNSMEKARKIIDEVYKTGSKRFEWVHKRFDGELFWVDVSLTLIPYRHKNVIFVVWRDISEKKLLEQRLLEEKERLAVTLRSIGDGIIAVDKGKTIVLMNKVAEKITGWAFEEAQLRPIKEVFNIETENKKNIDDCLGEVITKGNTIRIRSNSLLIKRNGEKINISDSIAPIKNKNSKTIGAVIVFRDITESLKAEKELQKAQKLESLALIAGGIAHDFNNLLFGIIGNLGVVKRKVRKSEEIFKTIERVEKIVYEAKSLSNQLLTFAKGGEPLLKKVDLKKLIKDIAHFATRGSDVKIDYQFDKDLDFICADIGQIEQVFNNLIINAVYAIKEKKELGKIEIKAENIKLKKDNKYFLKEGDYVQIIVKDNGIGIKKEILDKIFDPFFTTKEKGSGLGLSTSYSIIKKHGGDIRVESSPGKGTAFYILLPVAENLEDEKRRSKNKEHKKGLRVLIVDDEEDVRNAAKEMLEILGCKVKVASSGEEAIEIYKNLKNKIDLVIMDLTMKGGMSGEKATAEILKIDPKAKCIISSGYASGNIISKYKEYGFIDVLVKPYRFEDLEEVLSKI